ncbi:MAG: 2,3-bisphosphoglycerate-independent phosphoglycerate mutase, partial [Myxococcales bacterium]|nr:2,3-bisphosphoglycerate-independent phosphoglycerate mutase [Myxococcales bacterium]
TYDLQPEMSAPQVTDELTRAITSGEFDLIVCNYANGDMVGHTGDREAAVLAVQTVDLQLARILPVIAKAKGALIVTADHGNADQMYETDEKTGVFLKREDGSFRARTSHTLNPVPLHVWAPGRSLSLAKVAQPGLANVAATVLQLLGYERPEGYEPSLLSG